MDVIINENEINVPAELTTWGDLLDWLETDHLKAGQCITHVNLGGEEALNYRDSLVCGQDLTAFTNISVKCGEFDRVVRESLTELDHELKTAQAWAREIVTLFENRNEEEAYAQLSTLLDSIRIFFTIVSEDLGWADMPNAEISRGEYSAVLERALTQLIAAQENRFWVSICDVIEYEINPILEAWQKLVETTRARIN
jgi:hypothetical protein